MHFIRNLAKRHRPAPRPLDVASLFASLRSDPLNRALSTLNRIDSGSIATVFAYPGHPDLVVRISPRDNTGLHDGWFGYAHDVRTSGVTPHSAPHLITAACVHDTWIGITPRLRPIETAKEIALVEAVQRHLAPKVHGEPLSSDTALINERLPSFRAFKQQFLRMNVDADTANFMMDGKRFVVNDPLLHMSTQKHLEMKAFYGVSDPEDPQP